MITKQQTHSDVHSFINDWGIEPVSGMVLEILDKTSYDLYSCVITRIDDRGIWVKQDNETSEQLADISLLQTPLGEYLEDWLDIEDD